MAAGRHGGFRDREFRVQDTELDVSRKREYYLERHRDGQGEKRDGGESKRDSRRREFTNGFHRSPLSNTSSGSGSDRDRERSARKLVDREPGELSSGSGSDGTPEAMLRDNGIREKENENGFGPSPNKKRKFTPIVWDKEDKEKIGPVSSGGSKEQSFSAALPPLPPPLEQQQMRRAPESINPASEADSEVFFDSRTHHEFVNNVESNHTEEDEEEYQTTRNISSSRWADVDNTLDEDEDIYAEKPVHIKKKTPTLATKLDHMMPTVAASPELGEVISREGSEEAKSKSSESERGHSDGQEVEDDRNNFMDIDMDEAGEYQSDHFSDAKSEDEDGASWPLELERQPQRLIDMLQGCRSVDEFEKLNKIDEGTYGVVYRVKDKKTGEIVALKKVKMEKEREGFPLTSLREINILLSFHHPSIVDVKEVVISRDLQNIFMVMEYMEHDLKALMETMKQPFSQSEVKCLMLQLLSGVKYLHDNWVLHRDLKTSNLLFNNRGELKICDFGLSRQYGSPLKPYTQLVVTLWYRAPELLLGAKEYSTAIDMWSLGCIMAELLGKEPLFNGKTELDQLDKIFRILGNPTPDVWPEITELSGWKTTSLKSKYKFNKLREKFPAASFSGQPTLSEAGFNLLNQLLTYDPEKRITADDALNHEWFREVPLPKSKDFMPTFPAHHAQDRRHRRLMKSPDPLEELRLKELQGKLSTGSIFG